MIRSALTEQFGIMLEAEPDDDLDRIETGEIRDLLLEESGGAVLFRRFRATEDTFRSFTERHGSDFVVHHNLAARDYVGGDRTFATVNKGDYAIDFHNEMASNPLDTTAPAPSIGASSPPGIVPSCGLARWIQPNCSAVRSSIVLAAPTSA